METKNERVIAAVRASENLAVACTDGEVRVNRELVRQNIAVLGSTMSPETTRIELPDTKTAVFEGVKTWLIMDTLPTGVQNGQYVLAFAAKYECKPLLEQLTASLCAIVSKGIVEDTIYVINNYKLEIDWEQPIRKRASHIVNMYLQLLSIARLCSRQPSRSGTCCVHYNVRHTDTTHLGCCHALICGVRYNLNALRDIVNIIIEGISHTTFANITSEL